VSFISLLIMCNLQLGSYLCQGCLHFSSGLLSFLCTASIQKIGVKVMGDLTWLSGDCGFMKGINLPFSGALELGQLAKKKNAISWANVGLADLVSFVLWKYLPKNLFVCVSENWDMHPLSDAHASYAALDVFATWGVFYQVFRTVRLKLDKISK